jgi:hypothetical protein
LTAKEGSELIHVDVDHLRHESNNVLKGGFGDGKADV